MHTQRRPAPPYGLYGAGVGEDQNPANLSSIFLLFRDFLSACGVAAA